jgi:hypothetical protein
MTAIPRRRKVNHRIQCGDYWAILRIDPECALEIHPFFEGAQANKREAVESTPVESD